MKKLLLIILSSLFLFITSVYTSSQIELSLKELCDKSDNIIIARVISSQSYFVQNEKRIFTDISIQILETLKGGLKPFGNIKFTVLGGTVNGVTTLVLEAPIFRVGEESILFLSSVFLPNNRKNYVVSGFSQGKFNIFTDQVPGVKKVKREQIQTPLKLERNVSPILLTNKDAIPLKDFISNIKYYLK